MLTAGWRYSTARDPGQTPWRASSPSAPPSPWSSASTTSSVIWQRYCVDTFHCSWSTLDFINTDTLCADQQLSFTTFVFEYQRSGDWVWQRRDYLQILCKNCPSLHQLSPQSSSVWLQYNIKQDNRAVSTFSLQLVLPLSHSEHKLIWISLILTDGLHLKFAIWAGHFKHLSDHVTFNYNGLQILHKDGAHNSFWLITLKMIIIIIQMKIIYYAFLY